MIRAKPRRKFGNTKTTVGENNFDSKREAKRWGDLVNLQRSGEITDLERQVKYELAPSVKIAGENRARPALRFTADFRYFKKGYIVVEDCKGFRKETAFRIRQHLMKSVHGIDVVLS